MGLKTENLQEPRQEIREGTGLLKLLITESVAVVRDGKFLPHQSRYNQGVIVPKKELITSLVDQEKGNNQLFDPSSQPKNDQLFGSVGLLLRSNAQKRNLPLVIIGISQIGYNPANTVQSLTFIDLQSALNPAEGNRAGLLPIHTTFLLTEKGRSMCLHEISIKPPTTNDFRLAYDHFFPDSSECGQYVNSDLPVTVVVINGDKAELLTQNHGSLRK